jgi:hypothetical protein
MKWFLMGEQDLGGLLLGGVVGELSPFICLIYKNCLQYTSNLSLPWGNGFAVFILAMRNWISSNAPRYQIEVQSTSGWPEI